MKKTLTLTSSLVMAALTMTGLAQAAVSPHGMIQGKVVAFDESSVRLLVEDVPVVVPRSSIAHSENLRTDSTVQALVGWDSIQADPLGIALQKKNGKR
jgi:hypothetical protein